MKRFIRDKQGTTAVEYGILASLIAVASVSVMGDLGIKINAVFGSVSSTLNGLGVGLPTPTPTPTPTPGFPTPTPGGPNPPPETPPRDPNQPKTPREECEAAGGVWGAQGICFN